MTDTTAPEPLKINFELSDCFRCSGTGMYGPKSVKGGVCFHCNGEGKVITRNGSRALETFRALMAERMGTPAEEITEGSRVFTPADRVTTNAQIVAYPWKWRTVRTADVRTSETINTETGETTVLRTVHLSFRNMPEDVTHSKSVHEGEPLVIITPNREAHREIMREVAKRYKGAWLSTEEPPAPAAPRLRKSADVEPKPKPEPRTFPNRYAGQCVRPGCGQTVEEGAGECFKDGGRYVTQHKAGECPEAPETASEEAPAPEAAPAAPQHQANRYGGKCRHCSVWVEAEKGERLRVGGDWATQHTGGQCPAAEEPPAEPVAEEGLYRHDGTLYRVQEGTSGRLYARRIVRPEEGGRLRFERAPRMVLRISATERLSVEEAAVIGREWETCLQCGVELTDPKSIARGIGPDCAKRV